MAAPDGEARSRPGVTVAGGPTVQSDTGQNFQMSRAAEPYVSSAVSWTSMTLCSLPWSLWRCWPGSCSLRHGTAGSGMELHRPGCDRWLLSDACQFFGMPRGQGLRRTSRARCLWCLRGGGGGGWGGGLGVDNVRDGVLPDPRALSEVVDLPCIVPRPALLNYMDGPQIQFFDVWDSS